MKSYQIGLLASTTGSYDQTKTTLSGRVASKTISGQTVLGPPLTQLIDVQTDTAVTPVGAMHMTASGRLFVMQTITSGSAILILYNFNTTTGAKTYVGKVQLMFPNTAATTHTIRGIRVYDPGTSGWSVGILTTGSVLINGGLFRVNNLALADFVPVGFPVIPFATGNGQKAVYFEQDPAALGVNHVMTAGAGISISNGNKWYVHNGVSATHQYYIFDPTVSPTYTTASVSVTAASPSVVTYNSHPFVNNDPVVFTSATTLPTGFTVGTTYFVRNAAANTFELSATTGGASINGTVSASSGAVLGRAFGTNSSAFSLKTGNLPALTGVLLLTNSENCVTPSSTANSGSECVFFATTTALYLGKISELTSGVTTWASLVTSNVIGTGVDIVSPTPTFAQYSEECDEAIYVTQTSTFIAKQLVNSVLKQVFGGPVNTYLEGTNPATVQFGLTSITGMYSKLGWLFIVGGTTGQRVILALDLRSDALFDYSSVISPVFTTATGALNYVNTYEQLFDYTDSLLFQYRVSGFGSASGGWTTIPFAQLLNVAIPSTGIQFKILFYSASFFANSPAQVSELVLGVTVAGENSDYWDTVFDQTSSGSPTKVGFRMKKAYLSGTVPTSLTFRAEDSSGSAIIVGDTITAAPTKFAYSTDDGSSYIPLGTIPNTVGTIVQYTFTSPPGVRIRPSLRDS